jgi:hypothetical protein
MVLTRSVPVSEVLKDISGAHMNGGVVYMSRARLYLVYSVYRDLFSCMQSMEISVNRICSAGSKGIIWMNSLNWQRPNASHMFHSSHLFYYLSTLLNNWEMEVRRRQGLKMGAVMLRVSWCLRRTGEDAELVIVSRQSKIKRK